MTISNFINKTKVKVVLMIIVLTKSSLGQILTQDFEAPFSTSWTGTGSIIGSLGSAMAHSGGLMYKIQGGQALEASVSFPTSTKYIGFWAYSNVYGQVLDRVDLLNTSGGLVLNLGFPNDEDSYLQWYYREYQLGSGYSGNYKLKYSRITGGVPNASWLLDDIVVDTQSHQTSVEESKISIDDFKIYPNPVIASDLKITCRKELKNVSIEVYNATGALTHAEKMNIYSNESKQIDVNNFKKGLYTIKISNGNQIVIKKIIVE